MPKMVNGNVRIERTRLSENTEEAVDQTVQRMAEIAYGEYGSRSPKIRALAINIVRGAGVPEKDYYGETVALFKWVQKNIRYIRDPVNQETLSHPEETVFNSKAGDCLHEDTLLLSPQGLVRIADVRVGDTVYGKDGWTTVTNTWDKGVLPTKAYLLNNGGEFVATDDHLCFMEDGSERRAGDLKEKDALLQVQQVEASGAAPDLSEDDCRFLGLYLSDGWTDGNRVCIAGKDGFPKEANKHWVASYCNSRGIHHSWHPRYIRVYDNAFIASFGGDTAISKGLPIEFLLRLTSEQAKALLDGLLADSHQPKTRRSGLCFGSTSKALVDNVVLLYRRLGIGCKTTLVEDHGGLGKNPVYRVYPRLYRSKAAKIEEIVDAGYHRVYDIETEDHGIYLPEADVVVHNCDDMVVLTMALLGAIGIKSHPVVVGMQPGMYSHVYLNATIPPGKHRMAGRTVPLDPIMKNWQAGREAPASRVKARKDYKQLETLMMFNGYNEDVGDVWSSMDGGSNLGAYATGPSYLDTEYSGAEDIMVTTSHTPDITHDLVLSNTTKVVQDKEGIDGMLGMGVELDTDNANRPEALFSRGPMVSWVAKRQHRALAPGGKYIRKHYEGGEMEARLRQARGKAGANAAASPNRKIVTVNDGKKQITPRNAPLTIQEQSDELDGLHGMIVEKARNIRLAGLGSEDDPATQEEVKEAATLSWFARFKAKAAAARAGWLEQHAEDMGRMGRSEEAKAAAEKAKAQRALAKKAIAVAKEGVGLEKAAEKASPQAAQAIKRQQAELEIAQQEEPVAAEADEKPSLDGFFGRSMKGNDSWRERRLKLMRTRRERLDKKIEALEAQAQKVDNKARKVEAAAAKRQEHIEAPVAIRSMSDPAQRGRRNAFRRNRGFPAAAPANEAAPREGVIVPQQWEAMDPNVNQRATGPAVDGLGALPTINTPIAALNSPLVQYGALAAGLYFFMKQR